MRRKSVLGGGNSMNKRGRRDQEGREGVQDDWDPVNAEGARKRLEGGQGQL